jgi:murein DD-endopeptidase MepM/ murein hydrolase activator NlpD
MKSKKITSEAPQFSGDLLGGARVKIPRDKTHAGQSGWASSNAWDIPANISTPVPVYAIASGKVVTFKDYGPNIIKINGKKLFGIGFTVDSNDGLPDVYYTHLKNAQVKLGDKVECGQLLGYVTDFPESSFDHVHIGIEKGRNIREFIDSDGKIKCVKGLKMNGKDLG